MPASTPESDDESSDSSSPNLWVKAGIAGALGFEFVGFILAGVFVGAQIDAYFDSHPIGLLSSMAVAIIGVSWHIYRVCRRVYVDDET